MISVLVKPDTVVRKVIIEELKLPVDSYNYDSKLLTSIDAGEKLRG